MSMQDPLSDMLTRIRNAGMASLKEVSLPASKLKKAVASVLKEEGFIGDMTEVGEGVKKTLVLKLKYHKKSPVIEGIRRISKPSCRIYCGNTQIPKVRNGLGLVVLSTPHGVISGKKAAEMNIGGEIICYVW
ncbi:MAG TPA: 30S ribosomal protein S8 [Lentisphaeria bacterium]|nr:MAG: 30S ribosomal protein S8 [Lentisphaerae bacterium GWF2_38_69]HBM16290.1 30S ribosomal protein S8 [Lentisphaeria bacterium]